MMTLVAVKITARNGDWTHDNNENEHENNISKMILEMTKKCNKFNRCTVVSVVSVVRSAPFICLL